MVNRYNNAVPEIGGEAWNQKYSVAAATAALLRNVEIIKADGYEKVRGDYYSATAFSSTAKAACANFPIGSEVFDIQAGILWRKTAVSGTDTWKYFTGS